PRRRHLGGIPPIRDNDQVSAPDRIKIVRCPASEATPGQRRGRFTGYHADVKVSQDTVVLCHVEDAECERHDAQRDAIEHHYHDLLVPAMLRPGPAGILPLLSPPKSR